MRTPIADRVSIIDGTSAVVIETADGEVVVDPRAAEPAMIAAVSTGGPMPALEVAVHAHEHAAIPGALTFSSVRALELGGRALELVHPGRGAVAGSCVVRVPDADVLVVGALGTPHFDAACWPMEWPIALDVVLSMATRSTVIVTSQGQVSDRDAIETLRGAMGVLAETIRDLAGRGVPLDQALDAGQWRWPREQLGEAVRRGYEHLPRSQKRLPLL